MPDESDKRLLEIVNQLLQRTNDGIVRWSESDDEGTFFFTGSNSSIVVSSMYDEEGDQNVTMRVLNDRGSEVAKIRSTWVGMPDSERDPWAPTRGYKGGPNNKLLEDLYEAARRSALRIDDVLNSLSRDLAF